MHFSSATLTLLRRCSLSYRNQFLCDVWINASFIFILTLSAPTPQNMVKNTLKQFVGTSRQIVLVCLTILWVDAQRVKKGNLNSILKSKN